MIYIYNADRCTRNANVIPMFVVRKFNEKPMFAMYKQIFHFMLLYEREISLNNNEIACICKINSNSKRCLMRDGIGCSFAFINMRKVSSYFHD